MVAYGKKIEGPANSRMQRVLIRVLGHMILGDGSSIGAFKKGWFPDRVPLSNSIGRHIRAEALMSFDGGRTRSSKWDGQLEADYPHEQIQAYVFNGRNKGCLEQETIEIKREIYGIGNLVDDVDSDGNDHDKECVICLSEPRDTTVLPFRDK
ncbi:hypothetical protein Tco_1279327, partial [Tanacetum coccineum]